MVTLHIRNVPGEVRKALKARAAARGQSLQSFLLELLTEEARRSANLSLLESFGARHDGSLLTSGDAVEPLDAARAQREPGYR